MKKNILCILLSVLLLPYGQSVAYPDLNLGLGLNKECQITVEDNKNCRVAGRGEVLIDLFGKSRTEFKAPFTSDKESPKKAKSGCEWCGIMAGSGEGAAIVLVILIGIGMVYGAIWSVAALYSSEISLGVYYSQDAAFTEQQIKDENAESFAERRRYGLQLGLYPVEDWWFRIHLGSGPATAHTRNIASKRTEDYQDGRSTKAGIGIVPPPDSSGPFLFYEGEYLTINNRTWRDAINYRGPTGKEYRLGTAVMTGFKFAF